MEKIPAVAEELRGNKKKHKEKVKCAERDGDVRKKTTSGARAELEHPGHIRSQLRLEDVVECRRMQVKTLRTCLVAYDLVRSPWRLERRNARMLQVDLPANMPNAPTTADGELDCASIAQYIRLAKPEWSNTEDLGNHNEKVPQSWKQ